MDSRKVYPVQPPLSTGHSLRYPLALAPYQSANASRAKQRNRNRKRPGILQGPANEMESTELTSLLEKMGLREIFASRVPERAQARDGKERICWSDVAKAAGASRQAVALWLAGKGDFRNVHVANLLNVSAGLGVTPAELLQPLPGLQDPAAERRLYAEFCWEPFLFGYLSVPGGSGGGAAARGSPAHRKPRHLRSGGRGRAYGCGGCIQRCASVCPRLGAPQQPVLQSGVLPGGARLHRGCRA